jgi:pyridoxal phosphate enzyme (YggS family)
VAELIANLDTSIVRANLGRILERIDAAQERGRAVREGRGHTGVQVLAATKYVSCADMPALAAAGVRLVGENRAQDLEEKVAAHGELFEWDFIGQLQSRRVRMIVPHVRLIHSVASESAMRELERNRDRARPGLELLIEVDLAGELSKAGVPPDGLDALIERAPFPVTGLAAMPPLTSDPELSRPWFAGLRALADERGLEHLSMGTSQDYLVAVEEGATIVRIGTSLYREDERP